MLYFFMFIVFMALLIGPIVAGKMLKTLPTIPMDLLQPTGLNNNDTSTAVTGSALNGLGAANTGGGAATSGGAASTSSSS